jgi:hypothetical protein
MISLRRRAPDPQTAVELRTFREAMNRPAVAREFFLPLDQAWWDGHRFTMGRSPAASRPVNNGVRLQEPCPESSGPEPDRDTRADLATLFRSVAELRRVPGMSAVVLSDETHIGKQSGSVPGKRVVFGLHSPPDDSLRGDDRAAGECYRVVRRAVERAGYRVEHPRRPFDPSTGFPGLQDWAASVRLRRKRDWRPWLLLLLLFPLFFLLRSCHSAPVPTPAPAPAPPPQPEGLFGVPVEEESFVILLDKSGSMGQYFARVRDEAQRLMLDRQHDVTRRHYADLIVYDNETESVLGDLKPVTPERIADITKYLNSMQAGGWTNLAAAIDLAAKEVVRHKQKTTLIVITDGEDRTIPKMIHDRRRIKGLFGNVPVTINATTPRLFEPGANPRPATVEEEDLEEFCKYFNGRLGPAGAAP